jgi:hypothetical protein
MITLAELHPQYLLDDSGKRQSVVLSVEEYEALVERIEAYEDAQLLHEIAAESTDEDFENWDEFSARLRAESKLP